MSEEEHVFVSHIHEDDPDLQAMNSLLADHGFEVRDSSIDSSKPNEAGNPDYIMGSILAPRIEWAGTFLTLISPGTRESEWVNREIEYAQSLGKRIVGVWAHGSAECDIPEALNRYADAVVGWQAARIMDAIHGRINNWETASGEPLPLRSIPRYSCR